MTVSQLTNLIVAAALIEMMITIGLGVTVRELADVARDWRLTAKAAWGNYVCVPAATVGLLWLFRTPPMTAVGFLILAVCPGAPFGPPITAIGKGNVATAVGLMVLLAGSSAVLAPPLLGLLLPFVAGDQRLTVDPLDMVRTLLVTQLLPLCLGLAIRHVRPNLAERLLKSASTAGKILVLLACGLIVGTQSRTLVGIRPGGILAMLMLLAASLGTGWILGGPVAGNRKALTLTTSLRNVGVGLVIATESFPGTSAVPAVVTYAVFEIVGSWLLAIWWSRSADDSGTIDTPVRLKE